MTTRVMNRSRYCDKDPLDREAATQTYWTMDRIYEWSKSYGFKNSPRKSLAAEKPLECKLRYSSLEPRREPRKNPESRSIDLILLEACKKLQVVQTERYIMRQQAKIEGCKKGMNWKQLKHLEWFDYLKCPKKYVNF